MYLNGLNPQIFMEWAELVHLGSDSAADRHFHYLFDTFESEPGRYNLYANNITNSRYEYLDDTVPLNVNRTQR